MSKPIVVVSQAFSKQGTSILNTLLESNKYHVRALTSRPLDSAQAQGWKQRGVELIQADFLNADDLLKAYNGAHAAFIVRPLISPVDPDANNKEFNSVKTQADAAVQAGLQQIIYSSTDSPVAPKVQEYIDALPIPFVNTFYLSFFFSNLIEFSRPVPQEDGSMLFAQPFPADKAIPYVNPYTITGKVVERFLAEPTRYNRQSVPVVSEFITGAQVAETFERVTGIKAAYKYQSREDYINSGFSLNDMTKYVGNVIYDVWTNGVNNPRAAKDATTEFATSLNAPTGTWEQFLQATAWKGEPYQDIRERLLNL
ncbi:hypothetical protein SAMD00019534_068360 [Acytostelium subglobosum LB1]|uniref:hypothetical protein n=1 Tax=Acytostelium subglobosum LB1 TaxID=1410327 RepID=UPI0006448FFB|nr:hypothetical protein SAMD00019534_068360 [Acytostelium subglobosum LB1]GAM23661.1 hypothetical protein SAMD00019534_068360 [Acytostelium subglobosum LB1]|eukprot:XP_012753402.1 hypothetical protein SAMD00019534_068360 [Acytostelium subglobosum LB1]